MGGAGLLFLLESRLLVCFMHGEIKLIISAFWYSGSELDYTNNMNDDDRLKLMFSCGFYTAALHLTMFLLSLGM